MRFALWTLLVAIWGCVPPQGVKTPEGPPGPRRKFAQALNQVEEGMSAKQVLALLGPPDDVRTRNDPGGISTIGTKEIWRYGTSGHLTTATLGQVYLDQDSRAQYMHGKGKPPPEGLFEEEELRRILVATVVELAEEKSVRPEIVLEGRVEHGPDFRP